MAMTGQNTGDYRVPLDAGMWNACKKAITYVAGTTGATGAKTIFTVTGVVRVKLIAVGKTTITSGGTPGMIVGTAITTNGLLPTLNPTSIAVGEIWHDGTADASIELDSVMTTKIVAENIIETIATATLTAGVLEYILLWQPLSADGTVVAA